MTLELLVDQSASRSSFAKMFVYAVMWILDISLCKNVEQQYGALMCLGLPL